MVDYTQFPGLAGIHLEDSYVLSIQNSPGALVFRLDVVLTPEHPAYHAPRPGEHHCYAAGKLVFANATGVECTRQTGARYTDATGEDDLGNIDILRVDGEVFVVEGDWGEVRIISDQPRIELGVQPETVHRCKR
jgi:hypothetical protein